MTNYREMAEDHEADKNHAVYGTEVDGETVWQCWNCTWHRPCFCHVLAPCRNQPITNPICGRRDCQISANHSHGAPQKSGEASPSAQNSEKRGPTRIGQTTKTRRTRWGAVWEGTLEALAWMESLPKPDLNSKMFRHFGAEIIPGFTYNIDVLYAKVQNERTTLRNIVQESGPYVRCRTGEQTWCTHQHCRDVDRDKNNPPRHKRETELEENRARCGSQNIAANIYCPRCKPQHYSIYNAKHRRRVGIQITNPNRTQI